MAALYFICYALIATIAAGVIAYAQYTRMKAEGTPMNFTVLKVVGGSGLAMWACAGLTQIAYSSGMVAA